MCNKFSNGLRAQSPEILKSYQKEIEMAMNDQYPHAAAVASAIVYQEYKNPKTADLLKAFCLNENLDVVLLAINLLMYVDEKQAFVETIQNTYEFPGRTYNTKAACMDFLGSLTMVSNTFDYKD